MNTKTWRSRFILLDILKFPGSSLLTGIWSFNIFSQHEVHWCDFRYWRIYNDWLSFTVKVIPLKMMYYPDFFQSWHKCHPYIYIAWYFEISWQISVDWNLIVQYFSQHEVHWCDFRYWRIYNDWLSFTVMVISLKMMYYPDFFSNLAQMSPIYRHIQKRQ